MSIKSYNGLPWCLQCGRPGFNPWVRKISWRRKWQPTPVFLPGKSHGWRNLVGYSPWGRKESDTTSNFTHIINHIILLNSLGSCDNEIVYVFVLSKVTILEQTFKNFIPFSIYMNCPCHSSFYLLMYLRVEAYYIFVFLFYFFL